MNNKYKKRVQKIKEDNIDMYLSIIKGLEKDFYRFRKQLEHTSLPKEIDKQLYSIKEMIASSRLGVVELNYSPQYLQPTIINELDDSIVSVEEELFRLKKLSINDQSLMYY